MGLVCERGGAIGLDAPPPWESELDKEGGGAPSFPPSLPHKLSFLKVWGCDAYVKKLQPDKLEPKSEKLY